MLLYRWPPAEVEEKSRVAIGGTHPPANVDVVTVIVEEVVDVDVEVTVVVVMVAVVV